MTRRCRSLPHTGVTLAVAVLALAGCSTGPRAGLAAPAAATTESPPGAHAPAPVTASADPATWTLPIQAYQPTAEQSRTLSRAEAKLVGRCVGKFGIDWKPAPPLPPIGPRTLLDWRYGIHDAAMSAKFGYQVDPAQKARYDAALSAVDARPRLSADAELVLGGTDVPPDLLKEVTPEARRGFYHGRKIPRDGCFGEARRTLGTPAPGPSPLVRRLAGESYPRSMEEPAVKAVFARWSACMRARGFSYPAPMAANDDPRFRPGPGGVSRTEIATALADIDCRTAHRVAEVWHAAETRLQRDSIEANAPALAKDREALAASVRKATEVLAAP